MLGTWKNKCFLGNKNLYWSAIKHTIYNKYKKTAGDTCWFIHIYLKHGNILKTCLILVTIWLIFPLFFFKRRCIPEAYSESSSHAFCENSQRPPVFDYIRKKNPILDVWQGSVYVSPFKKESLKRIASKVIIKQSSSSNPRLSFSHYFF